MQLRHAQRHWLCRAADEAVDRALQMHADAVPGDAYDRRCAANIERLDGMDAVDLVRYRQQLVVEVAKRLAQIEIVARRIAQVRHD